MNHGSLFSGIGGFDLAAEWAGWNNVFHCEINDFGRKILKYYWPNATSYEDITKTDFTIWRGRIDIVTGGFPCQPFSLAGKRKGTADDRHLWPQMLRAIREIQPDWVVGENVFGIINWDEGLVFDQVQADLEAEGYEVQPYILPACSVGAPHRRDRVWFVAHRANARDESLQKQKINTDTNWNASHAEGIKNNRDGQERFLTIEFSPDADNNIGREGRLHTARSIEAERHAGTRNALFDRRITWDNFQTQSPVCSRNDGVSYGLDGITFSKWRNESIKAYGNAIVPVVAYQIFKAINQIETK